MLTTVSSVPSRVEPPAPYVQEKKRGFSLASSCHVARSFSFPSVVFGGKNSKLKALASIEVRLERRVDGAVHWRLEADLGGHAHHRAAEPGRLDRSSGLEVVLHRGFHLRMQAVEEFHAVGDEIVRKSHAALAPETPGFGRRRLEGGTQLRIAATHADRLARERGDAG